VSPRKRGWSDITVTDQFCGAGGSSNRGTGRGVLGDLTEPTDEESVKVSRKRPLLTGKGNGVGINKVSLTEKIPQLNAGRGEGVGLTRQIVDLAGNDGAVGKGIHAVGFDLKTGGIYIYMRELAERLRRVRVCCGDWSRVVTPAVTTCIGVTGVFLDPPYHAPGTERSAVYTHDNDTIWRESADWAVANGDNPDLRIALCGYEGEHSIPASWVCVPWKASGGYGRSARGKANRERERIWFSPHCLNPLAPQHLLDLDPEAA
jgi:hypothetical protein